MVVFASATFYYWYSGIQADLEYKDTKFSYAETVIAEGNLTKSALETTVADIQPSQTPTETATETATPITLVSSTVTGTPLTNAQMTGTATNGNIKECTDTDQGARYELSGHAGSAVIECARIEKEIDPEVWTAQFDLGGGELWFITLDRVGGAGNMYAKLLFKTPNSYTGSHECEMTGTPATYLVTPVPNVTPVVMSTDGYLRAIQDSSLVTFSCTAGSLTFSGTAWLNE
ncbi:hypothetical protein ACFL1A_03435 [Patescibacteria group bacterium]